MALKQEMKNYNTITPIKDGTAPEKTLKKWSKKKIIATSVFLLVLALVVMVLTAYFLSRDPNNKPDLDECSSSPCRNGGICEDRVNSYSCSCMPGFSGGNCESDIDECSSNSSATNSSESPCKNGGTCQDKVNSYSCSCMPGFTGANCESDIDECSSNSSATNSSESPCQNGGTCEDKVNSYSCSCMPRFTGVNCESYIRPTCSELGSATSVYDFKRSGMNVNGIGVSSITGSVAVADFFGFKVYVMDAELKIKNVIDEEDNPWDTTYDDAGFLYVTLNTGHKVNVYDSTGNKTFSFGSQGSGDGEFRFPWGITHRADIPPVLYVCDGDNKRVQVFHTNGTYIADFGNSHFDEKPGYIAVDTRIYVSGDFGALYIFTSTYNLLKKSPLLQSVPNYLALSVAVYRGCLLLSDSTSRSIKVLDGNYSLVSTINSSLWHSASPTDIAVTPIGAIYGTEYVNGRIQLFKVP